MSDFLHGRTQTICAGLFVFALFGCAEESSEPPDDISTGKPVVYQVFTRLFGNTNDTNTPWGTIEQNGVGKFNDFTDAALEGIRELGTTHIWYTGVPHHAVIRDYTEYGIGSDDPDVVKGRAGSPYAVKDYYNVNPDLAVDPGKRLQEFEALIERTHRHDMKVLIDIVPNHIARGYRSLSKPDGIEDFGASDDTTVEWARDNNFYYVVGEDFSVPEFPNDYRPLGGENHTLSDGQFAESPAKWTGNGAREVQPRFDDWFETVKVNYGVRPDGSYAFDRLPEDAGDWTNAQHVAFWKDKIVPDSWTKFRDIVLYWTKKGVDGFRYDMAEMVPVEFWSYLNSSIKAANPDAFLLAEVYTPSMYRDYIRLGRMDYLYDKVGLYDTLRPIVQGRENTDAIAPVHAEVLDIESHMLHFLENHDEQRIASPAFAGNANKAKPAMVVSALIGTSPTMLYFAQDVGEPGDGDAGFGGSTRTTIFDYWGVPAHQRWMNGGAFDGGALSEEEKNLRDFYARLMNFSAESPALTGEYAEIHSVNRQRNAEYDGQLFSFVRWKDGQRLIVVSNFSDTRSYDLSLDIPAGIIAEWQLDSGRFALDEKLYGNNTSELVVDGGVGTFRLQLQPLESVVYKVGVEPPIANDGKTGEFVPQWAKSAVWYQIFPDRFRNGDPSNDPNAGDLIGADPASPPKEWRIHPWGSDWYELQDYERVNGEPQLWYHIARRRYGGDLQGIIDKLDYIKELGINAIYLNPVFDSPSSHKYDGASYHHIDPNFGPSPDADRALMATENPLDPENWVWTEADELALTLIKEAHKRDIRIIFDGVFNHMGINSFAFKNLKEHQQDSPYKDWFTVNSFDDPVSGTTFDYEGWFGVKSLPEFKEDEMGLVSGPREYVFNATRRWMNPKGEGTENGIDGWRLDVAFNVHHNFWKAWRKVVKSINPDAYLTAEIVATPDKVIPYFQGDEFDGEMNYNFAFTAAEFFFHTNDDAISVSKFDKKLRELRDSYPEGVAYVTQNLFGSHDSNRIGSHIVNRNIGNFRDWGTYFGLSQAANTPEYDVSKPQADDIRLQKLFAIFQMTYVGAPMIYYGDEVGMWGANDPDCRKPMLWPDVSYEDEVYLVNGNKRPADTVSINEDLKAHYQSLIRIRRENSALATGRFDSILIDNNRSLYGFVRKDADQAITVILNNSNEAQEIEVSVPTIGKSTSVTDLLTTRSYVVRDGKVGITLPAKSGVILTEERVTFESKSG